MKTDAFLLNLGLARRAGALSVGTAAVLDAIRKKQAGLVYYASDVSEPTLKKLKTSCAFYETELRGACRTMTELSDALGQTGLTAAVAVSRTSIIKLFK